MSVSLIDGHIDDDVMTDEQIIKALEYCIANDNKCPDCPIFGSKICGKPALFFKEVFDLINRQNAEIERLNRILNTDVVVFRGGRGNGKSETIRKIIEARVAEIRAKAYKECIEKAKEILHNYCIELVDDDLDNLVKEMVGEEA